jgi:Flp pilus assembly protein TadD
MQHFNQRLFQTPPRRGGGGANVMRVVLASALLLCVGATPCVAQPTKSISGDDFRVAAAYDELNRFQPDRALAHLIGPYTSALRRGDLARASRYLLLIATAFRFDENSQTYLRCCQQAALLDPQSTRAKTMVAAALLRNGRWLDAEKLLMPMQDLSSKDWLVARALGELYGVQGNIGEAHKYLVLAESLAPAGGDPRIHSALARLNFSGDSVEQLRKAAQCTPSVYLKEIFLWQAEQKEHRDKPNKEHLLKAAMLLPDEPSWRTSFAWATATDDEQKAKYMREAVECKRAYVRAHSQMAVYALFKHKDRLADAAADHLAKLQPQSPDVYFVYGQIAAQRGQVAKAEDFYRQALALNPQQSGSYQALSGLSSFTSDEKKQEKLAEEWTSNCPYIVDAWLYKGKLACHRQQWLAAKDDLARAEQIVDCTRSYKKPRMAQWLSLSADSGLASYRNGETERAIGYACMFNELKPDDSSSLMRVRPGRVFYDKLDGKAKQSAAHGLLADLLFETGQLDDCVKEYQQAIALEDNIEWHRGLLKAFIDKRDFSAAAKEVVIVDNHAILNEGQREMYKIRNNIFK